MPRAVGRDHPPRAELGRKRERLTPRCGCDRTGDAFFCARLHGEVHVDDLPAHQGVPDRAADDPAALAHLERYTDAGGLAERFADPAHGPPTYSRSTRAERPVVTS